MATRNSETRNYEQSPPGTLSHFYTLTLFHPYTFTPFPFYTFPPYFPLIISTPVQSSGTGSFM